MAPLNALQYGSAQPAPCAGSACMASYASHAPAEQLSPSPMPVSHSLRQLKAPAPSCSEAKAPVLEARRLSVAARPAKFEPLAQRDGVHA